MADKMDQSDEMDKKAAPNSTTEQTRRVENKTVATVKGLDRRLLEIRNPPTKGEILAVRSGAQANDGDQDQIEQLNIAKKAKEESRNHAGGSSSEPVDPLENTDPTALFRIPGLQTRVIAAEEIKASFDAIDVDGNGCLDASDLRYMLNLAGEHASDEEITEMIRIIDHDASGEVGYEEFHSLFAEPPTLFRDPRLKVEKMVETELKEENRTVLDTQERQAIMKEFVGSGALSSGYLKYAFQRFQDVDKDQSGSIGYEEFLQVVDREDDEVSKKLFEMFDRDGSGDVEFREFVVAMANFTTQTKDDKIKMAFALFDNDASGFIEQDELWKLIRMNPRYTDSSDDQMAIVCESLYMEMDMMVGGAIDFNDFQIMCANSPEVLNPIFTAVTALEGEMQLGDVHASKHKLQRGQSYLQTAVEAAGGATVSTEEATAQIAGRHVHQQAEHDAKNRASGAGQGPSALYKPHDQRSSVTSGAHAQAVNSNQRSSVGGGIASLNRDSAAKDPTGEK